MKEDLQLLYEEFKRFYERLNNIEFKIDNIITKLSVTKFQVDTIWWILGAVVTAIIGAIVWFQKN